MISFNNKTEREPSRKAKEILSRLAKERGEENVAFTFYRGCILVRLFCEGGYSFLYPQKEDRSCDVSEAIEAIREYAVREEIGLLFEEVPKEELSTLISHFRRAEAAASDLGRGFYKVLVKSEADTLSEPPAVESEGLFLTPVSEEDIPEYARLCRDSSGLRFWGYDYREDTDGEADEYFYEEQKSEFSRGVSLCLAVRYEDKFIGEASFYAFDYLGGAEISFRLLPEYRGRGLGRRLLLAIFDFAAEISLLRLYATVNKNNLPSLVLVSEYMDKLSEDGDIFRFSLSAEDE